MIAQRIKNLGLNVVAAVSGLLVSVAGISCMSYIQGGISFGDASGLAVLFVTPLYLVCLCVSLLILKIRGVDASGYLGFLIGAAQVFVIDTVLLAFSAPSLQHFFDNFLGVSNFAITVVGGFTGFVVAGVLHLKKAESIQTGLSES
jgi:hypothetical protein